MDGDEDLELEGSGSERSQESQESDHSLPVVDDHAVTAEDIRAYADDLRHYISMYCEERLLEILFKDDDDPGKHFSVELDHVYMPQPEFQQDELVNNPMLLLPLLEDALRDAMTEQFENHPRREEMVWKPNVHPRIFNLSFASDEASRSRVPKCCDAGKLITFQGTVVRVGTVKMLEYEKSYCCTGCKDVFIMKAEFEQFYGIPKPSCCPNEECDSTKFKCLSDETSSRPVCKDYQEIKIQEKVETLAMGTIPRSLWVVLEDDLVDGCQAGDDVQVTGVVLRRWKPLRMDDRCDVELVLRAHHLRVTNEQRMGIAMDGETRDEFAKYWEEYKDRPLEGRNEILAAFCPQVFGMYVVKMAVFLVMIGGVARKDETGTRIRGESHMLLVGDPGTGKSQFLKYAAKLVPRSVITTGIGSTNAGLTCAAVKDGGEWTLEAGALVLADRGICCIDEFNSIREHDRASIHEAMEQQTLSVAKAGLVCKLNTRTTVLAATNPKGKYDPNESLSVNIALASPLLSRFDIVLVLLDTHNKAWDTIISSFILGLDKQNQQNSISQLWTMVKLQMYVAYVKMLEPVMSEKAQLVLRRYYEMQRMADLRNTARTTIRLLESMVRISEAHARMMCHSEVTLQDAIVAITVIESSMQGSALLGQSSPLHSAFPPDADAEYVRQEAMILERLGLSHLSTPEGEDPPDDDEEQPTQSREKRQTQNTHDHQDRQDKRHKSANNSEATNTPVDSVAASQQSEEMFSQQGSKHLSQHSLHSIFGNHGEDVDDDEERLLNNTSTLPGDPTPHMETANIDNLGLTISESQRGETDHDRLPTVGNSAPINGVSHTLASSPGNTPDNTPGHSKRTPSNISRLAQFRFTADD